ncbi:MAG TPA: hypothetical protein VFB59_00120, partial [Candidatus Saccharimonadales bacterium]|nr:hypothetical protein [Candidatus Saccharimonadales bacterium]
MSELNFCPTNNICERTVPDVGFCGSKIEHLPALVPPGQLCVNALWNRLEIVSYKIQESSLPVGGLKIEKAGLLLELSAIPPPAITEAEAEIYTDFANQVLSDSELKRSDLNGQLYSQAVLLSLFSSDFRSRSGEKSDQPNKNPKISHLMNEVREALFHTDSEHIVPRVDHELCFPSEGEKKGVYTKLACFALCEMAGIPILPATWRCRRACDAFAQVNDHTVPVKFTFSTKSKKETQEGIAFVTFEELVLRANTLAPETYLVSAPTTVLADKMTFHIEQDAASVRSGPKTK